MANLEVLALDTAVPQIRAPGAGDGYSVPRDMTMASGTTLAAQAVTSTSLGTTGNLTFSSTAQRITGDMSNATVANRLAFQSSTTNSETSLVALPNGTSTVSRMQLYTTNDGLNSSLFSLNVNSTTQQASLQSTITGTGTYLPMVFNTGGSERMRLDTSGNLGIGTASPGVKLDVSGVIRGTANVVAGDGSAFVFGTGTTSYLSGSSTSNVLTFYTNSAERLRIDSSGNVGIGGTAFAQDKLSVTGTLPTSSNISIGFSNRGTIPSGSTTLAVTAYSRPTTQASAFTLASLHHFSADPASFGAGSTVTNQIGFLANSSLTGATNNYGFYSDIASGSNRWNFYSAGSANNYFAGNVSVGTTSVGTALTVASGSLTGADPSGAGTIQIRQASSALSQQGGLEFLGSTFGSGYGYKFSAIDSSGVNLVLASRANSATWTERMRITQDGNIVAGGSVALATTATDGFLYVPTCAGTPTGTPTAITGMAPIVVDTTNNKLYFYSGGQWRDAGP